MHGPCCSGWACAPMRNPEGSCGAFLDGWNSGLFSLRREAATKYFSRTPSKYSHRKSAILKFGRIFVMIQTSTGSSAASIFPVRVGSNLSSIRAMPSKLVAFWDLVHTFNRFWNLCQYFRWVFKQHIFVNLCQTLHENMK